MESFLIYVSPVSPVFRFIESMFPDFTTYDLWLNCAVRKCFVIIELFVCMAHIHFDSFVPYLSHVACKLLQIVSTEQQTQQTIIFPLAFVSMDFLFTANETEKCLFCIWFSVPSSRLSHPLYYCYFVHRCVYYYNKSRRRRRRRCACVPVHSLRLYGIQHSFNLLFGGNIRSYFLFFWFSLHSIRVLTYNETKNTFSAKRRSVNDSIQFEFYL